MVAVRSGLRAAGASSTGCGWCVHARRSVRFRRERNGAESQPPGCSNRSCGEWGHGMAAGQWLCQHRLAHAQMPGVWFPRVKKYETTATRQDRHFISSGCNVLQHPNGASVNERPSAWACTSQRSVRCIEAACANFGDPSGALSQQPWCLPRPAGARFSPPPGPHPAQCRNVCFPMHGASPPRPSTSAFFSGGQRLPRSVVSATAGGAAQAAGRAWRPIDVGDIPQRPVRLPPPAPAGEVDVVMATGPPPQDLHLGRPAW